MVTPAVATRIDEVRGEQSRSDWGAATLEHALSDKELDAGGLTELRRELARELSVDPDLPLSELVHAVRIAVMERREAREYSERIRRDLERALRIAPTT